MATAWHTDYWVKGRYTSHGPYPDRQLANRLRNALIRDLGYSEDEVLVSGRCRSVKVAGSDAPIGTATVELKADDSQLQAALDRAEERIAGLQARLDSLRAAEDLATLQHGVGLHDAVIVDLDRRLQLIERVLR